ncbi:MAG TPA: radical SAM protein, partial [Gammaproteobacteria bacterium]|nr:radical SAM protein [Gammaproteobacteria bacterium]
MALQQAIVLPPLSIYIHFPWCIRKCPYCDFNSHGVGNAGFDEAGYLTALARDLEMSLPAIESREVRSVFIGGGTPSLLSGAGIRQLLQLLGGKVTLMPDCEITLEANPGAADLRRFEAYRSAGVNRLSIGVQSFADTALRALGR